MPFIRNVRVLCKTRLIFPRINGPILSKSVHSKTPRKQVATEKCWLLMNELNVWQKIVAGVLHSADGRFFSCCFFFFCSLQGLIHALVKEVCKHFCSACSVILVQRLFIKAGAFEW